MLDNYDLRGPLDWKQSGRCAEGTAEAGARQQSSEQIPRLYKGMVDGESKMGHRGRAVAF